MTDAYIAELQRAVRDLPKPIADDIVSGVREELRGLDAAAARDRIAELGDPQFIAASARGELPPRADKPWYTVLTIALLAVGGFIVPVLGWLVGLVMLWYSRTWTLRDKLVGTLVLPVVVAVLLGISALVAQPVESAVEQINPQVPSLFSLGHSVLILAIFIVPIITTIYLTVRARRLH